MQLADGFGDTIRIALTVEEQRMPYLHAVAAMEAFLIEKLGAQQAAEYEHVNVSDPGFAHFRRVSK